MRHEEVTIASLPKVLLLKRDKRTIAANRRYKGRLDTPTVDIADGKASNHYRADENSTLTIYRIWTGGKSV